MKSAKTRPLRGLFYWSMTPSESAGFANFPAFPAVVTATSQIAQKWAFFRPCSSTVEALALEPEGLVRLQPGALPRNGQINHSTKGGWFRSQSRYTPGPSGLGFSLSL